MDGCGKCDLKWAGGFGEVVCHIHWMLCQIFKLYKSIEWVEDFCSTSTVVPFILPAFLLFHPPIGI